MLRKFVLLFGAQVVFGATLVINNLILSRILGPSGRGMVALLVAVPMVTWMLANLGFHVSAPYLIVRGEAPRNVVFGTTFVLTALISVFIFAVAAALHGPVVHNLYQNLPLPAIVLSIGSIPAVLLVFYFEPIWVAINAMRISVAAKLIQSVAYFGCVILLVVIFRFGVVGGIAAFAIGAWAAAVFVVGAAIWLAPGPRFQTSVLKRGLAFGMKAYIGYCSDHVIYRADTFVLTYLSGFQQLGYYAFAQPLAELIWYISNSMRPVLFARVAGEGDGSQSRTPAVVRLVLSAASVVALGIFAAAWLVVRWFLPAFHPALPALAILLASTVIAVIFQLLLSDVTARGHAGSASAVSLLVLPVALLAYFVLIPRYGAIGAATGSLISYSLMSLLAIFWVKRLRGLSPADVLLPRRADYALVVAAVRRMLEEGRSA